MNGKLKKIDWVLFIGTVAYFTVGNILHRYIIPEAIPDISGWFKPGQVLYFKTEGIGQTVI